MLVTVAGQWCRMPWLRHLFCVLSRCECRGVVSVGWWLPVAEGDDVAALLKLLPRCSAW